MFMTENVCKTDFIIKNIWRHLWNDFYLGRLPLPKRAFFHDVAGQRLGAEVVLRSADEVSTDRRFAWRYFDCKTEVDQLELSGDLLSEDIEN
jgi:hypothetical protein